MTAWSTSNPAGAACVYASDDHGSSWKTKAYFGCPPPPHFCNHWIFETSLAAVGPETLYLNGRNHHMAGTPVNAPHPRITAWSTDSGDSFHGMANSTVPSVDPDENGVQQGLVALPNTGQVALLAPTGPAPHEDKAWNPVNNTGRRHLVLHRSHDRAKTWPTELQETITSSYGGYSSLAVVTRPGKASVLGLLYETGWPGCGGSCSIAYTERPF